MGAKSRGWSPNPSGESPLVSFLVDPDTTRQMHRTRMLSPSVLDYDWCHPRIRFVQVPWTSLDILGPFESEMRALAGKAAEKSGQQLPGGP